jgi:hypothetical protein
MRSIFSVVAMSMPISCQRVAEIDKLLREQFRADFENGRHCYETHWRSWGSSWMARAIGAIC